MVDLSECRLYDSSEYNLTHVSAEAPQVKFIQRNFKSLPMRIRHIYKEIFLYSYGYGLHAIWSADKLPYHGLKGTFKKSPL